MQTPKKALFPLLLCLFAAAWATPAADPPATTPTAAPPPLGRDSLVPASSGGAPAVDRALSRLQQHRRLLMVAAHPDDEDTRLLTLVSRGLGGEAAYLSLSRGDGGQNLIGPEVGPGLGLLRSRELQAARNIDGARQFFTRAYDFGFTSSLDETRRRWPQEALIEDALRVARRFRPQVLVAVFPSSAQAGHGQHWVSALTADELYRLAGDPASGAGLRAEGLEPWNIQAFYRVSFFRPEEATTRVPLTLVDPFLGRSMLQIALESRSQHRCQDMGQEQPLGDMDELLQWQAGGPGAAPPDDVFAGIDTRLRAIAATVADPVRRAKAEAALDQVAALAADTRARLVPSALAAAAPPLGQIVLRLRELEAMLAADSSAAALLAEKRILAEEAYATAAGLQAEALADRETVVPGEKLSVRAQLWNAGKLPLEAIEIRLAGQGFALAGQAPPPAAPGFFVTKVTDERQLEIAVAADAPLSMPYFRRRPLGGDLYDWTDIPAEVRGEPFEPPPLRLRFSAELGGVPITLEREAVYRYRDQARGEVRRPLRVVPALEVSLDRGLWLWPLAGHRDSKLHVEVRANGNAAVAGELQVAAPAGWPAPPPIPFELPAGVRRRDFELELAPPPGLASGRASIEVAAVAGGQSYRQQLALIDYPHIRPVAEPRPARLEISAIDLAVPKLRRLGYVRGASDQIPELLRELALPVELLDAATLAGGDLSGYDAIVVGPRAYEVDPALIAANARLLDYAKAGGLVVVQYQQYQYVRGKYPPLPLEIKQPHDRVTDESSAWRLLAPEHPAFANPNRIGEADWAGWVQERGLYFGGSWDPAWQPLLALKDPHGDEKTGALLVADYGRGRYVYTGLAFFRQLPAGVPGAWRLFMNLLALRPTA
jgi:LmbE family N-acetylglucosaminyl deacetylase